MSGEPTIAAPVPASDPAKPADATSPPTAAITDNNQRVAYVQNFKLRSLNLDSIDDGRLGAVLNAAAIKFPRAGFDEQLKEDIQYSLLWSAVVAGQSFDPIGEWNKWYNLFAQQMTTLGWSGLATLTFVDIPSNFIAGTIATTILEYVESTFTQKLVDYDEYVLLIRQLDAKNNTNARVLFTGNAMGSKNATFQLGFASAVSGAANIDLSLIKITEKTPLSDPLDQAINVADTVMFKIFNSQITLDGAVYALVRDTVKAKMTPYLATYTNPLF